MKCIKLHFSVLLYSGLQIDNVGNPSWQAQIKGTKKWTLEPPPECALVCDPKLEVTVHPGEISMLFDLVSDLLLSELKLSLRLRCNHEKSLLNSEERNQTSQLDKLTLIKPCTFGYDFTVLSGILNYC